MGTGQMDCWTVGLFNYLSEHTLQCYMDVLLLVIIKLISIHCLK